MTENFSMVPKTPLCLTHSQSADAEEPVAALCSTAGCGAQQDAAARGSSRTEEQERGWVAGFSPCQGGISMA